MRIDVSFLPALAAAFLLVFARIGTMVMLMPGLGEVNVPVRIRLGIALALTLIMLPLHRAAYQVDLNNLAPLPVLLVHEILIGLVLGATARVTISALAVAGSVVAQQLGLGFVTAVDPTQGQQGVVVGNFLTIIGITLLFATDLHHLVIAALTASYTIFKPGELMSSGDVAMLATKTFALAFKIGVQLSAPFLVFGLVFNLGPWRAGTADAADAGLFRRRAAVDSAWFSDSCRGHRNHDGNVPRLLRGGHARADAEDVIARG